MRNQRGNKLDWSKPFKQISSKKEFDSLQAGDYDSIAPQLLDQNKKQPHQDKKQQIIVPKIQVVKRATEIKPFSGIPYEYIRLRKQLNLPKLVYYQLTQVDHIFVNAHEGRFKFNNKNVLTTAFLQKAFIEMQTKAGKDPVIPRAKGWMTTFIETQYKQYTKMEKFQQFAETVYNYWRNRRQELKFPLLRPLWRPNPEQYGHLLAFKQRDKQKRNLRRANRVTDEQIGTQLIDQFSNALKIVQRIKTREELKLKSVKLQILSFHNQTKALNYKDKQVQKIYQQFKKQSWQEGMMKDKEKIKQYQNDYESIKKKKQVKEEYIDGQQYFDAIFDQKTTVANFLATVVSFAQNMNVSHQSLFSNNYNSANSNSLIVKIQEECSPPPPPKNQKVTGRFTVTLTPAIQAPQPVHIDKGDYLNVDLSIEDGFLYRSFSSTTFQEPSQRPQIFNNYFDYKVAGITNSYFGQDDQGDFKDLKRNIAANFKKFQQQLKRQEQMIN